MGNFSDFNITVKAKNFEGNKIQVYRILDKNIMVHDFKIEDSKFFKNKGDGKCLYLQISLNDEKYIVFTSGIALREAIQQVPKNEFPFSTTIIEKNKKYLFT